MPDQKESRVQFPAQKTSPAAESSRAGLVLTRWFFSELLFCGSRGRGGGGFLPSHEVLFDGDEGDVLASLAAGFELITGFAELAFLLGAVFERPVIFDGPPPLQVGPVAADD